MRLDRPARLPIGVEVVAAHMRGDALLRDVLVGDMYAHERKNLVDTLAGLLRGLAKYCDECGNALHDGEGARVTSETGLRVRRHRVCHKACQARTRAAYRAAARAVV